jgi:hypothetical protein
MISVWQRKAGRPDLFQLTLRLAQLRRSSSRRVRMTICSRSAMSFISGGLVLGLESVKRGGAGCVRIRNVLITVWYPAPCLEMVNQFRMVRMRIRGTRTVSKGQDYGCPDNRSLLLRSQHEAQSV